MPLWKELGTRRRKAGGELNLLSGAEPLKEAGVLRRYYYHSTCRADYLGPVLLSQDSGLGLRLYCSSGRKKMQELESIGGCWSVDDRWYIPFRPDAGDTYLDFINFWIRPLNFTILRTDGLEFASCLLMDAIGTAYSEAARVYKVCMSTTPRPPAGKHAGA